MWKNGFEETVLLKAIAVFEVKGMLYHHRILHVQPEDPGRAGQDPGEGEMSPE